MATTPTAAPARARRIRSSGWRSRDVLRAALLVAAVWLSLQLLWVARSVFFLAFLGVLFGLTLSSGTTWLQRRGVPRGVGAVVLALTFLGVLAGLAALAAPRITEQWHELERQLPDALSRVEQWLRERQGGVTGLLQPVVPPVGAEVRPADIRPTFAAQIGDLGRHFLSIFSSTLSVLAGVLLVVFVAVYLAIDPHTYRRGVMHLVPHRARAKASVVLDAMGATLRRWLVAQLIGMATIGVIITVVLSLLDVRAAVALGIIAGMLEFIPYFGPIASSVPGIAMGFLDGPEKALWVALAYLVVQQLEGNVVIPLLMKEGVDLPPLLTILGQAALALVFGLMGLVVAVPLLGAVMVPIKMLYVHDVVGDEVPVPGGG